MIMSVNNAQVKYLTKLKQRKYQDLHNQLVVEGEHLVFKAKELNLVVKSYTTDIAKFPESELISEAVLQKISTTKSPQKIIALINKPIISDREKALTILNDHNSKVLILDRVQDPGNLGTILRTAKAFGIDLIILSAGCCSVFNSKVVLSSQGAFIDLLIYDNADLETLIIETKRNYVATSLRSNAQSLQKNTITNPTLIFGNEGSGISKSILDIVETHLKITINDAVESLNVAIACAIGMYHFFGNKNN